jgi:3',5'-cyclic-nucleotide phosphodiesterase
VVTAASCPEPAGDAGRREPAFTVIVLGASGGLAEDDLSSFVLAPRGETSFVGLDAGTLGAGLRKAAASFPGADPGAVLRDRIKAFLISHAHLDHIAGLVINAPEAGDKLVLGLPSLIDVLASDVFNWRVWPNFADTGDRPLGRYRYVVLEPAREQPIPGTAMGVEAFALSHGGVESTAFLIRSAADYVLYVGDTGPDAVEGTDLLLKVWTRVAPLVRDGRLRGMFIEASYPDERPDDALFGHMTPAWLMVEMRRLRDLVNDDRAMAALTVIATHVKPSYESGTSPRETIRDQLRAHNDLGLTIVVPRQGDRIEL